jgi:hypothetical protein
MARQVTARGTAQEVLTLYALAMQSLGEASGKGEPRLGTAQRENWHALRHQLIEDEPDQRELLEMMTYLAWQALSELSKTAGRTPMDWLREMELENARAIEFLRQQLGDDYEDEGD